MLVIPQQEQTNNKARLQMLFDYAMQNKFITANEKNAEDISIICFNFMQEFTDVFSSFEIHNLKDIYLCVAFTYYCDNFEFESALEASVNFL